MKCDNSKYLVQLRANTAVSEYLKEICTPPYIIKEAIFDETMDSAIACAKQNVDDSKLSDEEKENAKSAIEITVKQIAQMFKDGMRQSGKLK